MLVLSLYILFWIAIPLIGLIIGARLGLPAKWRATLLYSATTVALAILAYFVRDPFTIFQTAIGPVYQDTYPSGIETPNYYGAYMLIYGAFGLVHAAIAFARPNVSVALTSAQFWLEHIGTIVSILPMSWTIMHMRVYIDEAMQTDTHRIPAQLWHSITMLANTMLVISFTLLLGLSIWAIWSKVRSSIKGR